MFVESITEQIEVDILFCPKSLLYLYPLCSLKEIVIMKILVYHQHFAPETVGTSTRAVEIVEYLSRRGHDVTVVTGLPCHTSTMRNGEVSRHQPRFENIAGARVHRVWTFGSTRPDTFWRRMLTYGSFMITGGLKALFLRERFDVMVAISPLPNGIAAMVVSKLRGWPMMFDVCDIWPDCAIAVGMLQNKFLQRIAFWFERKVNTYARRIGVVTRGFITNLTDKGVPLEKIRLLPDWVDLSVYDASLVDREAARQRWDLDGKFVASFLGNFGLLMGLEALMDTARVMQQRGHDDILFLFVGKGAALPMIEDRIKQDQLRNVRVMPYQPRELVPSLLAASDVLLVTYRKDPITLITTPSKIYEYMAIERPIVAGVEGVIGEILTEAGCGLISPTRNPEELADYILQVKAMEDKGDAMGHKGREYARRYFTFEKVSADYEQAVIETYQSGENRS